MAAIAIEVQEFDGDFSDDVPSCHRERNIFQKMIVLMTGLMFVYAFISMTESMRRNLSEKEDSSLSLGEGLSSILVTIGNGSNIADRSNSVSTSKISTSPIIVTTKSKSSSPFDYYSSTVRTNLKTSMYDKSASSNSGWPAMFPKTVPVFSSNIYHASGSGVNYASSVSASAADFGDASTDASILPCEDSSDPLMNEKLTSKPSETPCNLKVTPTETAMPCENSSDPFTNGTLTSKPSETTSNPTAAPSEPPSEAPPLTIASPIPTPAPTLSAQETQQALQSLQTSSAQAADTSASAASPCNNEAEADPFGNHDTLKSFEMPCDESENLSKDEPCEKNESEDSASESNEPCENLSKNYAFPSPMRRE